MNWIEYLEMVKEPARKVCEAYGLPYACCVAQGAVESQWGRYGLGNGGFNIFGRKAVDGDEYVEVNTGEDDGTGHIYYIQARFKSYNDIGDAINDWCQLMIWGRYKPFSDAYINQEIDLEAFVRGIASVYATDIYYGDKVMDIINDPDCELR